MLHIFFKKSFYNYCQLKVTLYCEGIKMSKKEARIKRFEENLTEEQRENMKGVAKIAESNKGNFFQSISFQNLLVYGIILVAFIVYAIVSNQAV